VASQALKKAGMRLQELSGKRVAQREALRSIIFTALDISRERRRSKRFSARREGQLADPKWTLSARVRGFTSGCQLHSHSSRPERNWRH